MRLRRKRRDEDDVGSEQDENVTVGPVDGNRRFRD